VATLAQNGDGLGADQAGAADDDDLHGLPPFSKPQAQRLVQFVKRRQGMVPSANLKATALLPNGISTLAPVRRSSRDSPLAIAPGGQI
jgi:hypothetical protein